MVTIGRVHALRIGRPDLMGLWTGVRTRTDAGVVVLVVLPWLLLLADPLWVFSPLYRDTWAYFGAFQNLPAYLQVYHEAYSAGRLTVLIPGWLAYQWFPPVIANHVLHLSVYYTAVLSAYVAMGRTAGRRAGLLTAVTMGGHHFFLRSVGWDYVDGFAVAYFLLTMALLTQTARSPNWRAWAVASGAAAGALAVANLGFALMLFPLAGFFLVLNRTSRRHPVDAVGFWIGCGVLGLIVLLGFAARALGGEFLFLVPSLSFMKQFGPDTASLYIHPPSRWAGQAAWLVFPAAAAVGAAVFLARTVLGRLKGHPLVALPAYYQVQLLAVFALLAVGQSSGRLGYLEAWFYASGTVMVVAFLAAGGQWGRWLDALPAARFRFLAAVWVGAVVLSGVSPDRIALTGWGTEVPLLVALVCAVGAILIPHLLPPRLAAGIAAAALFAVANVVVRDGFRMGDSVSSARSLIALDRAQELDPHRKAAFLAISDACRWVRELDETGRVWYCYNLDEPLGPVYDMIAHTNYHHYKVLSFRYPEWTDMMHSGWEKKPATLVVFSSDPRVAEAIGAKFREGGLDVRIGERARIGRRAPVIIQATVLRIRPRG